MKTFGFSNTDIEAIKKGDYIHLNDKGVDAYLLGEYEVAKEYYLIASAMGCVEATYNLGNYYLNTKTPNLNKAICYYTIAANFNSVDSLYKLGNIYRNGIGIEKDVELGLYYYKQALSIIDDPLNEIDYRNYPSLFFALAKEYLKGGAYPEDLSVAYIYLKSAMDGYEIILEDETADLTEYKACKKLISSKSFDNIKKEFESMNQLGEGGDKSE